MEPAVAMRPGHIIVHGAGWGPLDEVVILPGSVNLWTRRGVEFVVRPDGAGTGFELQTPDGRLQRFTDSMIHRR